MGGGRGGVDDDVYMLRTCICGKYERAWRCFGTDEMIKYKRDIQYDTCEHV